MSISNVGARTCPLLALIAFFIAFVGVGFTNVALVLVLLAIPPILTNAYVGTAQVDPDTVDSARGMGFSEAQVLTRIELPIALPTSWPVPPYTLKLMMGMPSVSTLA